AVSLLASAASADCRLTGDSAKPGRKYKLLAHRCGGHDQLICPARHACVDGASYDSASVKCQVKSACNATDPGRDDSNCFSLWPCGAGGRRSCANLPFCQGPFHYAAGSAICRLMDKRSQ